MQWIGLVLLGIAPACGTAAADDLRLSFQAAVELNADIRALAAQRDVLAARRRGTNTLLPGAPTLSPSWRTQVTPDRSGYQEFEIGIDAPVWLPGDARRCRGRRCGWCFDPRPSDGAT